MIKSTQSNVNLFGKTTWIASVKATVNIMPSVVVCDFLYGRTNIKKLENEITQSKSGK